VVSRQHIPIPVLFTRWIGNVTGTVVLDNLALRPTRSFYVKLRETVMPRFLRLTTSRFLEVQILRFADRSAVIHDGPYCAQRS
jgi:hypothetical protein